MWRGHLSSICRPRRDYLQVGMIRLFQKKGLVRQNLHNLPRTSYDSRDPVVDDLYALEYFANTIRREQFHDQAEYKTSLEMRA